MPADSPAAPVDILDELLSPPAHGRCPEQEALQCLLRVAVPLPAAPTVPPALREGPSAPRAVPASARTRRAKATAPGHAKIKTSQYFTPETHARLDRAKRRLVRAERHKGVGRISQSRIVETAVRRALEEFEALGTESRLCRDLETRDAS